MSDLEKVMQDKNKPNDPLSQQALAAVPPVTVIPQDRIQELNIDHPGHIKYASQKDGGKYVGCRLEGFTNVEAVNEFFERNSNLVVIEMFPPRSSDGAWTVLYTNQLEREEMEMYLQLQEAYTKVKEDLLRSHALARAKEEEELDKQEAELERLSTLGKKCEANHGKLEKMREERDALLTQHALLTARLNELEKK